MSYDALWNNPMVANVGHFHLSLMRSVCFNDVIFSSQLLLLGSHKLAKSLQIKIKLCHCFIAPVNAEMRLYCSGDAADVESGFSEASVGELPARFTLLICSGLIPV